MKLLWRMAAGGVLGALMLITVNLLGSPFGLKIAVNPFTAMAVGFLGIPGAILVIVLRFLM